MSKDKSDAEKKARKEEKKKRKLSETAATNEIEEPVAKKEKKDKKKRKSTADEDVVMSESVNKVEGKNNADEDDEPAGADSVIIGALVPFAKPLAMDEKQQKKILKAVKRAAKAKTLKRGVKETVKAIRKTAPAPGVTRAASKAPAGIVVIAADISPMDVISHIPVLCEDYALPYLFIPSRAELGAAGSTKRPTSVVMLAASKGKSKDGAAEEDEEWTETFTDLFKLAKKMEVESQ